MWEGSGRLIPGKSEANIRPVVGAKLQMYASLMPILASYYARLGECKVSIC